MKPVQIYKTSLNIPAYKLLDEDLNPMFGRNQEPYPYTLQSCRSRYMTEEQYEAVVIENEYIKFTVIPQLGGRVHSAFDKINKKDIFFKNTILKPRMIATRGAWFCGGIEFNFPVSHSPNTMSRVNYSTRTYEDGSASIVFGNIEMMSYMNWKVELKLYPGKMFMEENVRLYNPTSYENRYYFWTNAAVEYNENIKLIYPFDWCVNSRALEYVKWPYYNGINCCNPKEIPASFEVFGKLLTDNYFGVYDLKLDYGVVHYADTKKVKGAKFFIWGNDVRSVAWNRALTDNQKQYFEIQSGLFESQAVYKFLQPYQELSWSEYWYPVFGIGCFKYAEKGIALNYTIVENEIRFEIIPLVNFGNCLLAINVNNTIHKASVRLETGIPVKAAYSEKAKLVGKINLRVDIYDGLNQHVLSMSNEPKSSDDFIDLDLYEDCRVRPDPKDDEKLFKKAVNFESMGRIEEAYDLYLKNLEVNRGCTLTLNRLGRIYLKKDMYDEAQECFRKVLQYDNRNYEARFLYGISEKEKGNIKGARRFFADIPLDSHYFIASVVELVKTNIILGYYKEAITILDSMQNEENDYILFLKSICIRKYGLKDSRHIIHETDKRNDGFSLAEDYVTYKGEIERQAFLDYIRSDKSLIFCISLQYAELGLIEDAETILELCLGNGLKEVLLSLWYRRNEEDWNEKWSKSIMETSLNYQFVNEKFIAGILTEYCKKDSSGRLDYILGNYRYWQGRREDALELFMSAYTKGLRYTVLLRNIGYILYYKKDIEKAESFFEEDVISNNSLNEDCMIYLARIYKKKGSIAKRKTLLQYMDRAKNRSLILPTYIFMLKDLDMEEKALEILESEEFENWEGMEISGIAYREVIMNLIKKNIDKNDINEAGKWADRLQEYPENLNYGETIYMRLADVHYYKGLVYSLSGMHEEAEREFKKGAGEFDPANPANRSNTYAIKCIQELQKMS